MKIHRYGSGTGNINYWWLEWILNMIDIILYIATVPFVQLFSQSAACYLSISKATEQTYLNWWKTLTMNGSNEQLIKGPCLALLSLLFLPLGATSFLIWVIMCKFIKKTGFTYVEFGSNKNSLNSCDTFKFVSGNLLLGPEFLGKMQNLPDVYSRLLGTANSFAMQDTRSYDGNCKILEDNQIKIETKRDSSVVDHWPEDVDFVALQEVWDRLSAIALICKMRKTFKYFLTDICQDNGNSKHLFRSSGLFIASKYPIVDCKAAFFDPVAFYQNVFTHAYIFVKFDLSSKKGGNVNGRKLVGYLANTHLPSYEDENSRKIRPLTELHKEYNEFQRSTLKENEDVAFAVVAGDFNLCNISKCDKFEHNNPIYNEYLDYCREKGGVDHSWTVGTEVRQLSLPESGFRSAEALKNVLKDDVKRRFYILDADLEKITPFTPFSLPIQEEDGTVVAKADTGGKRRVDKILYHPEHLYSRPHSFFFVTALAPYTDHVPICLVLKRNE